MRLTQIMRLIAISLALVASLGLAACSSDGDSDSTEASGQDAASEESVTEYCEAFRSAVELSHQATTDEKLEELRQPMADAMVRALAVAPAEVRGDFHAAFAGDPYAYEDVQFFNKEMCDFELTVSSTP